MLWPVTACGASRAGGEQGRRRIAVALAG